MHRFKILLENQIFTTAYAVQNSREKHHFESDKFLTRHLNKILTSCYLYTTRKHRPNMKFDMKTTKLEELKRSTYCETDYKSGTQYANCTSTADGSITVREHYHHHHQPPNDTLLYCWRVRLGPVLAQGNCTLALNQKTSNLSSHGIGHVWMFSFAQKVS